MKAPARWWAAVADLFTGVPIDATGNGPKPGSPAGAAEEGFGARLAAQLRRSPIRVISGCLATVLGPAVVAQARPPGPQPAPEMRQEVGIAAAPLPVPVPGDTVSWARAAGRAAETCPGLPSAVLVAIARVESSLGLQTWTSPAGAVGPMQFLPGTWSEYGADGDGDGYTDVMNPVDAIHGAARLLCANGGADPERLPSALWNYNHSDEYVRHILALARFTAAHT